ncbi:MAG TPA: peptidylprolyl isomerase [Acidimicrobiia bacterium]|nr:peptidylprolyl isomerase [Acidimicrobiia bacterium]
MKKLISIALASALALAACGGSSGGVAATVNDTELTVSDVEALPYESSGTMEPAMFAQYLTVLIQLQILEDAAAAEFSVEPAEDTVDAEIEELLAQQGGEITLDQIAQIQGLSPDALRRIFRATLIQEEVADGLGETLEGPSAEELDEARRQQEASLTEVCVRHILIGTAEEAEAAMERIEGGESFEDVAAEVSTDPSAADNGGDLGCAPAGQYVDEFRDAAVTAEIDELAGPVESTYGFHVLQVYDRTAPEPPSDDELREQLLEQDKIVALEEWLMDKFREADVTVNEEYGTWVVDPQPMVQPPGTESQTPTPDTSAPATTAPSTTSGG